MGRNKSCDPKTREKIVELFKEKKSYSEIASVIKCSKTMVFNAIQNFLTHSTVQNIPRKPKARITTSKEDSLIIQESEKNPHKSAREIIATVFGENESAPSVDTVKRRLREAGLFGRVRRKDPLVSEQNRQRSLEFTKRLDNNIISTGYAMPTIVVDEMNSKGDTPKILNLPDTVPLKEKTCPEVTEVTNKTRLSEVEQEDTAKWHEMQLKFLDHVLFLWLNRTRSSDPNIVSRNVLIKAKAKETADILGTYILTPNKWLRAFKAKLKAQTFDQRHIPGNPTLNIVDIIAEEWPQFCYGDESLSEPENSDLEEGDREEATCEKVDREEDEIVENPLETYEDALGCLRMVEDYALCVRNLRAVILISQMEEILSKRECV